ncbi:MAG: hypothetical protein JOZ38_05935, partial [Candidatus Eremiobacteraeota bacterium]|nr:hypothetical protein [Candidatus Eremiobacteraeota bacterium]
LLVNNPTYIVGAQLPGVPLHKWQAGVDQTIGNGIDAKYTQYYVGQNNSKNTTSYNYGELTVGVPFSHWRFNVVVSNVFNQYVQWNGLIGNGVPLALNQYATAAQYAPLVGAGATESYGLPSRQIFVNFTFFQH